MFQLIIIWSVLLFECLAFGITVKGIIDKITENIASLKAVDFFYCILIGFVTINAVVQAVCLVKSIDIYVQTAFLVVSIVLMYYKREQVLATIKAFGKQIPRGYGILFAMILVGTLLVSSCKPQAVDTYSYHAQTVRWIEEMGTVKGIANIHMRLGYNSAVFAMSALYSFVDVFGQSVRSLNGFIIVFAGSLVLFHIMQIKKHVWFWGDCIVVSTLYYFYYIRKDISSLDNCSFSIIFVLVIILLWCRILEQQDDEANKFFLTLFVVYLATVKLNHASLGLLCVLFLYQCIFREKKYKKCVIWLICAGAIAGIWMIRNAFVSGYLVYPFYQLDLLPVDWKVPLEVARDDYDWIVAWARTGVRGLDTALGVGLSWMPIWFCDLFAAHRVLAIAVVAAPIMMPFVVMHMMRKRQGDCLLFFMALCVSYVYWLFSTPSLRFGMGWVLAIYSFAVGCILNWITNRFRAVYMRKVICIVFICMIELGVATAVDMAKVGDQLSRQIDYTDAKYDYGYLEMDNGIRVYFPVKDGKADGRAGYWNFPATNDSNTLGHLEMRGESLKQGFRTNYSVNNF